MFRKDGKLVAGVGPLQDDSQPVDAAVAKARELGAGVVMEPMDAEGVGRFAVLTDPQGATFGVIKNAPQP